MPWVVLLLFLFGHHKALDAFTISDRYVIHARQVINPQGKGAFHRMVDLGNGLTEHGVHLYYGSCERICK